MATTRDSQINTSTNLTPLQIRRKVALMERGVWPAAIARQLGKSKSAISQVMLDQLRSREIEDALADASGVPVEELFPYRAELAPA